MSILGLYVSLPAAFISVLHALGIWLLYHNRIDLLYDNEDNDPNTPNTLSLGRCWSWLMFYLAFSYWLRYSTGEISSTTPFPPGLQEMLYACLIYEMSKKGIDVSRLFLKGKRDSGYNPNYYGPNYASRNSTANTEQFTEPGSDYVPSKSYADDGK